MVEVDPFLEGDGQFIAICFPDKLLASLVSKFLVIILVAPDREGPLDIFIAVSNFSVPDGLQSLVFGTIHLIRVELPHTPHVKHSCQEFFAPEVVTEVFLLTLGLHGLETLLVPLFDSDFQPVLAKSVEVLHELLQRSVALSIKLAVLEELTNGQLLAAFKHLLK